MTKNEYKSKMILYQKADLKHKTPIHAHMFTLYVNLIKARPLFTLSHRGSDNSPLLILFNWTLNELCICILRHDFDQSDNVFQMMCGV